MERKLLSEDEVRTGLNGLTGWSFAGGTMKRRFEFESFSSALHFVNQIGEIAEAMDHHPDIFFGWGHAEVATTTHDRGGITGFDLELARRINEIGRG